jgi:hypothetical protein
MAEPNRAQHLTTSSARVLSFLAAKENSYDTESLCPRNA